MSNLIATIVFYVHGEKQTIAFTLDRESEVNALHVYIDTLIENDCAFKMYVSAE